MTKLPLIGALAIALCAPGLAQTTSYVSNNLPAKKGDPKRLVCEVEEQIGSRLGKKKICMTAEEWNDKHNEHRDFAEHIQSGAWPKDSTVAMPDGGLMGSTVSDQRGPQ